MNPPSAEFRRLMGHWATGVSVVTASDGGEDHGLTVNAFLSVTLEPPTVLVSLTHDADTTPIVDRTRTFAVNLLAFDQKSLSQKFAEVIPHAAKFDGLEVTRGSTGAPLLTGTLGALEAEVDRHFDVADHRLFLGRIVAVHAGRDVAPLLFFRSRYASSDGSTRLTLETG
ncbi:MAG TPA: flavin reductase family protein [Thermoplasmata archaeon]|nr:flavin reductase family protein [Thermoplasmata archaeon]